MTNTSPAHFYLYKEQQSTIMQRAKVEITDH